MPHEGAQPCNMRSDTHTSKPTVALVRGHGHLGMAAGQVAPLGLGAGRARRHLVRNSRLAVPPEAAQQVRAGGRRQAARIEQRQAKKLGDFVHGPEPVLREVLLDDLAWLDACRRQPSSHCRANQTSRTIAATPGAGWPAF